MRTEVLCAAFGFVLLFCLGVCSLPWPTEIAPLFPEPDHVYNSQDRTCMVYMVEGSTQQYWQCSDGCEYIGYWSVDTERRLVCPGATTTTERRTQ